MLTNRLDAEALGGDLISTALVVTFFGDGSLTGDFNSFGLAFLLGELAAGSLLPIILLGSERTRLDCGEVKSEYVDLFRSTVRVGTGAGLMTGVTKDVS